MRVLVAEGGEGLGFWREELIRRRFGRAVEKDMVEEREWGFWVLVEVEVGMAANVGFVEVAPKNI